jgi:hypothetical protein
MECRLGGETEVLGENLPQRHFCQSQNPTWPEPGLNPGRRGGKPATNRLSYGAAPPQQLDGFYSYVIFNRVAMRSSCRMNPSDPAPKPGAFNIGPQTQNRRSSKQL